MVNAPERRRLNVFSYDIVDFEHAFSYWVIGHCSEVFTCNCILKVNTDIFYISLFVPLMFKRLETVS